jgi:hypothetical protein
MAVSEAAQRLGSSTTDPVPLVYATPGPLASVLYLLELTDRHSAECEELVVPLAGHQCGQWVQATYASHNRIRQQSLEWDTHDCGCGCVAVVLWGAFIARFAALGPSERRLVAPALLVNSKAKGAHFQAGRTASPHALPPSCNYSRCRSTLHIPTNRATRPLHAPICCNNCVCQPAQPSASPQRRPA